MSLSIIIAVRVEYAKSRDFMRLLLAVDNIPPEFEVIIVDDGSPFDLANALRHSTASPHIKCYRLNTSYRVFSLARARNFGASKASGDYLLFQDVDFFIESHKYSAIYHLGRSSEHASALHCIPVLFLTEAGTQHFNHALDKSRFIHESLHDQARANFLVLCSSAVLLTAKRFREVEGYNEQFKGHGAEDFEFLHKVSCRWPKGIKDESYLMNCGSGDVRHLYGFRRYFSAYGREALAQDLIFVHLWHPRRVAKKYYTSRKKNFSKLLKIMARDINTQ